MGSHAIPYAVVALAIAAVCLAAGFAWGRSNVKAQIENAVEKEHVALDAREFAMRTQLEDAIAEVAKLRPVADELGRVQKRLEREQAKYAQLKAEFDSAMGVTPETSPAEDSEAETVSSSESADEAIQKLLQSLEVFNDPDAPAAGESAPVAAAAPANSAPAPPVPAKTVPASAVATKPPVAAPPVPSRSVEAPRPTQPPKPVEVTRPAAPPRPVVPPARVQVPMPPPAARPAAPAASVPVAQPLPPAPQPQKAAPAEPRMPVPNAPAKPAGAPPAKSGQKVDEWQEFARELEALTGKKKQA
ncbi:hypothetical protein [Occallatibacter savannae]|uniref:hypothetical protein n=1 Tax=Occallatibacter savannae TaxID=1002691 RepID=UPI000D69DD20|nr:hypothetical protein [Occallatibacter savannae]